MKTARGNQEQENFAGKENVGKDDVKRAGAPCYWCSVITKNQDNSIVPPSGKDAIIAASSGIFLGLAEVREVAEVDLNDGKPT